MAGTATQTKGRNDAMLDREGKYLTFALAHEEYGLEILKVREIIGYIDVTAVPQTPPTSRASSISADRSSRSSICGPSSAWRPPR